MCGLSETRKEIILALAEYDMSPTAVSKALHFHRNTILFHTKEILRITGKNPMKFYDLVELLEMVKGGAENER